MRIAIALAVLVICRSSSFSQAAEYPPRDGPVSDYSNKLSPVQVVELTSLIEGYERQTSIEIVVVVADSLQGQSAREYATGIGNAWGVGKVERNNGIVLLWAPKERAYSLRIADGLSHDLSNEDATDIMRNNLLPNFRREDYYDGLKETLNAVMRRLGNESWEERLRLRQERSQSSLAGLIPALVAGLSVSAIVGMAIYRRRQRYLKRQEMAAVPGSIAQSLRAAQQNASRIQQLLGDFQKEMPEQDLTRFASNLAEQPDRIAKIEADAAILVGADITFYAELLQVKDRAEAEADLLSTTRWRLDDIRQAKAQSQLMLQRLSNENFQVANVRDESKREEVNNLLSNGRSLYNQAHQNSSMSLLDWMVINDLLNSSHRQVLRAVQVSQAEPYTSPPIFGSTSYLSGTSSFGSGGDSSSYTSDTGSVGSGSDSSSYTSDSGSFGGGGDFGGGGGFSGGSGSDGSY